MFTTNLSISLVKPEPHRVAVPEQLQIDNIVKIYFKSITKILEIKAICFKKFYSGKHEIVSRTKRNVLKL